MGGGGCERWANGRDWFHCNGFSLIITGGRRGAEGEGVGGERLRQRWKGGVGAEREGGCLSMRGKGEGRRRGGAKE